MLNLRFGRPISYNKNRLGFGISESIGIALAAEGSAAAAGGAAASAAGFEALGTGVSLLSTGIGALGSIGQSQAQKASANYNAAIAANNAAIAQQTATRAAQAGEAQAEQTSQKTRATVGAIKAAQAGAGIDVNSGSAVDVRSSAEETGQLDALTVRSNAAKTAYGYQTQAASDTANSQLDKFQAENASTAGYVNAGSNILGGVSSAADNYSKFLLQNNAINTGSQDYSHLYDNLVM